MNKEEVIAKAESFIHGGMTRRELYHLWEISEGKQVCEIGSMLGMSSFVMENNCRQITCIDTWGERRYDHIRDERTKVVNQAIDEQIRETLHDTPFTIFLNNMSGFATDKVRVFSGTSADTVLKLIDGEFDFLLVDGDHSYEGVLSDLLSYRYKVRPQGIMVLHDYGNPEWPEVEYAAHEFLGRFKTSYSILSKRHRFLMLKVNVPRCVNA
jgi:predicted O-methyltransferase YrrM